LPSKSKFGTSASRLAFAFASEVKEMPIRAFTTWFVVVLNVR
jgi:hypothetical protein